jgi:hypothetical protein
MLVKHFGITQPETFKDTILTQTRNFGDFTHSALLPNQTQVLFM